MSTVHPNRGFWVKIIRQPTASARIKGNLKNNHAEAPRVSFFSLLLLIRNAVAYSSRRGRYNDETNHKKVS